MKVRIAFSTVAYRDSELGWPSSYLRRKLSNFLLLNLYRMTNRRFIHSVSCEKLWICLPRF